MRIRLGVSRSHSIRDESTVLKVYLSTGSHTESRSTAIKSFLIYPVNRETCKVHNLLQLFEGSKYHLVAISSANNKKNCQFYS